MRRSVRALAAVLVLALAGFAGSAAAQSVGVQGDRFTIDGEAKFLTFISYFDAMRATDVAGDYAFIKDTDRAGFDGVRIFPNWWMYSDTPTDCPAAATDTLFDDQGRIRGDNGDVLAPSGRLVRLFEVLRAAQAQRLIVDLSFARETVPGDLTVAEYTQALQRTAFLLREYRNVIFDIQNERDNADPRQHLNTDQVRAIRNAIKAVDPQRLVMASMNGSGATVRDFNLSADLDVVAFHDPRVAGWQDATTQVVQDLRQIAAVAAKPIYLQEPTRWRGATNGCGAADTTSQSDPNPEHFRTALRRAKEAGAAGWTFHSHRTFRLPATGPLHQQIQALLPGNPERELYLGAGQTKLSATPAHGPYRCR